MRILFDTAVYDLSNKGNVAMLQAAVNRIAGLWPEASIRIIAQGSQRVRLYFPKCEGVDPYLGRVSKGRERINRLYGSIPRPALRLLMELREEVQHRRTTQPLGQPEPDPEAWRLVLKNLPYAELDGGIDLLVATGGQYMADVVKPLALGVLNRLELAIQRGIPTVMVGQGIGPIEDAELISRAQEVLPRVELILIREKKYAPTLLSSLGVQPDRVVLTGDDAIEMAFEARSPSIGQEIGVGMRVAHYTKINEDHLASIQLALSEASQRYGARLISLPISHGWYEAEVDDQVIRRLSAGQLDRRRGLNVFDSPSAIIKSVSRCRVVVTGAFHPAVFALAQGIPAVCLAKSNEYVTKFMGLADQFGPGCQVIVLDGAQSGDQLRQAIDAAWSSATQLRPQLLEAGGRQIEWGHAGYQRIFELVTSLKARRELVPSD